jgi:TonB family protein
MIMEDPFIIAGHTIRSRFLLGTGKFSSYALMKKAIEVSGAHIVTVALRSDGSVEGVTINRSSGAPEIDRAIQTIVMALSPYPPFPRDLAMDYDVIEIRRVWTFDNAVRLFSGGR